MFSRGIMPLYTLLGGSWPKMSESVQRILVRLGLEGHYPKKPEQIIEWLEATARGWDEEPTPPFEWGGRRATRAKPPKEARFGGGSGACSRRPIRRRRTIFEKWQEASDPLRSTAATSAPEA